MFEGWVAEALAMYLGKFIDVQRDRLRISLWGGESLSTTHRSDRDD